MLHIYDISGLRVNEKKCASRWPFARNCWDLTVDQVTDQGNSQKILAGISTRTDTSDPGLSQPFECPGANFFFNLGARCGWVVNAKPRPFYPRERDLVAVVQEVGWVLGPVWTGADNFRPLLGFDARNAQPQEKIVESKRSELICT